MARAAVRLLPLALLSALLGVPAAEEAAAGNTEGLDKLVSELEGLVLGQQERLKELEAQVGRLPAERRLADFRELPNNERIFDFHYNCFTMMPVERRLSLYADTGRQYGVHEACGGAVDHAWLILSAVLVMFMSAGFAMIEAGSCRLRNIQQILLKKVGDLCMSTLGWWIFGWSFAYSGPYLGGYKEDGFAGRENLAGSGFIERRSDGQLEPSTYIVHWFVTWAHCCAATTIASAGLAERASFIGCFAFSFLFSAFVFPFVVAWTWGRGWLNDMNGGGFYDYAGSGVLCLAGGTAALVGGAAPGPLRRPKRWPPHQGGSRGLHATQHALGLPRHLHALVRLVRPPLQPH